MSGTVAILAGGLATRLRGVVDDRPKCLVEINGKPFLDHLLHNISTTAFREVVMLVGHLGAQIEAFAGNGSRYGLHIEYAYETEPLGTAGAIKNAEAFLRSDFLALNGDTLTAIPLDDFFHYHLSHGGAATIALCEMDDVADYGSVLVNNRAQVTGFREKRNQHRPGLVNAGVYAFSGSIHQWIPGGAKYSVETELFPKLLASSVKVQGFRQPASFLDIGTPERLRHAQRHPLFATPRAQQGKPHDTSL